eukprot:scaffold665134_cov74-Prasinocladus_malaysianus.AAC.1
MPTSSIASADRSAVDRYIHIRRVMCTVNIRNHDNSSDRGTVIYMSGIVWLIITEIASVALDKVASFSVHNWPFLALFHNTRLLIAAI